MTAELDRPALVDLRVSADRLVSVDWVWFPSTGPVYRRLPLARARVTRGASHIWPSNFDSSHNESTVALSSSALAEARDCSALPSEFSASATKTNLV